MTKYYDESPLVYPKVINNNSDDIFIGNGWDVTKKNGKYFFYFISGQLEGREKSVEINKDDFNAIKNGEITFDDMCRKYGVS